MRNSILFFVLLPLMLSSCTKVVKVLVPPHTPAITANAVVEADKDVDMRITRSRSSVDTGYNFLQITNATVKVYESGLLMGSLIYTPVSDTQFFNYQSSGLHFEEGKTYHFHIEAEGYDSVSADVSIPKAVGLGSVSLGMPVSELFPPSDSIMGDPKKTRLSLEIDDPSEDNYYALRVSYPVIYYTLDPFTLDTMIIDTVDQDLYLMDEQGGFFGSDASQGIYVSNVGLCLQDDVFNGQHHQFVFTVQQQAGLFSYRMPDHLTVDLISLSKDLYEYYVTSVKQQNTNGDPFSEPVLVHNNVTGGYGIIAGQSRSRMLYTH